MKLRILCAESPYSNEACSDLWIRLTYGSDSFRLAQGYRIKIRELASIASQGCIVRGSPVWSSIIREQKRPREALSGGEKLNAIALPIGVKPAAFEPLS